MSMQATRSTLRVLNAQGDSHIQWDHDGLAARDPEAIVAVLEAERIFEEARSRGGQAFRVTPGNVAERLSEFDRNATEILVIPAMVGG